MSDINENMRRLWLSADKGKDLYHYMHLIYEAYLEKDYSKCSELLGYASIRASEVSDALNLAQQQLNQLIDENKPIT